MSDWEDIYHCPVCEVDNCVPPNNLESSVLIVGEEPEGDDEIQGMPLVGRTGTILRQMLARMDWDLSSFGVCNLWQHKPNKNEECLAHGKQVVVKSAKGKKVVLLIGSDVAKEFLTKNISELNGMKVNDYLKIPLSAPVVMAMMNPAVVFHNVHGEIVLALQNFIREVEKIDDK